MKSMKAPETIGGKLTLIGALLIAAASFTTMGGAIVMWEDVRPWMSEAEERAIVDRDKEIKREATKLRREMAAEDKLLKERSCENTLARLQSSLFQALSNEASAVEMAVTLIDPQAVSLNRRIIQQAREAQRTFEEQYNREKKECDF